MESFAGAWPLLKQTFSDWNEHEAPRLGAALAFYTVLSLSPLVVLALVLLGFVFDRASATRQLLSQVESLLGPNGSKAVQSMLESTQSGPSGTFASIASIVTLLLGASGILGELRTALNRMWDVKPASGGGVAGMLRERLFSFGMLLAIGFLLLASLLFSALLAAAGQFMGGILPAPQIVTRSIDLLVSLLGLTGIFALMYKYVPEQEVKWNDVWIGAAATAVLFTAGKYLIGFYLVKAGVGSAYGAAGSLVVVIVWVYYTAQIVLFGAEFTHVYAHRADGTAAAG